VFGFPSALVLSDTDQPEFTFEGDLFENTDDSGSGEPELTTEKFHITTKIENRYAQTTVETFLKNHDNFAHEYLYKADIPADAFIADFRMIIDDREYIAEVKAKDEAEEIYNNAVSVQQAAGLVSLQTVIGSESISYRISTNIPAGSKTKFRLVYEHLLERNVGKCSIHATEVYEHKINVAPLDTGDIINDMRIQVIIDESLPLDFTKLFIPELRKYEIFNPNDNNFIGNISYEQENTDVIIDKDENDPTKVVITFIPSQQYLIDAVQQSVFGQFVVKYDVLRREHSDLEVIDGYFIHYFSPENLQVLPKVAIFVLDVSGSMVPHTGRTTDKLKQVKDAMFTILEDDTWTENDYINILAFNSQVNYWNSKPVIASRENRDAAFQYVRNLGGGGGTNLHQAVNDGLSQADSVLGKDVDNKIVFFLTDGQPTVGVTSSEQIRRNIKERNGNIKASIYGLGFGTLNPGSEDDSDYHLDFEIIKGISDDAGSFARRIYDSADAALQLECYLSEVFSVLVTNLKSNYIGPVNPSSIISLRRTKFLKGSEDITMGKIKESTLEEDLYIETEGQMSGISAGSQEYYNEAYFPILPSSSTPVSFLPRLYTFITIKQLIDKSETDNNPMLRQKAQELAIQHNFVTKLTSLVVSLPTQTLISDFERLIAAPLPDQHVAPQPVCPCRGSITFYDNSYFRGEQFSITEDTSEFISFDNRMVSVKVKGGCKWKVFEFRNYAGRFKTFEEGNWPSVQDIGDMFRAGSSAQKIDGC
jgi:uncharacterized protein YegL